MGKERHKKKGLVRTSITVIVLSLFTLLPAHAQRETQSLNDSWKFLKGECNAAAADSAFNDNEWTGIHLPHTWNTDAYTEKDYYRGQGWYRRQDWKGKQIFLRLDAASKAATIYINGKNIGEHAGGYTACTFNITPFLSFGSPNVLAIRVDNASKDIPPISGDFTFFGGIYRDVWLTAVPNQHFDLTNHGSDGIFITTPQVSEEQATLSIRGEIKNEAHAKATLELTQSIYQPDGTILQMQKKDILLVTQRTYKTEAELKPAIERTLALANRLEKVLKEEDITRVSTMAFHGSNSYNETGISKITDIVGWNLYQGWYGGDVTGFERYLEQQHRDYPTHPMIVSEYGAGADKRLHSLTPKAFDFSIEYQQKYLEHYLPVLEDTPYICGGTHWNFIDFSSALRDESMPRINNKGLVYADRTPKDVYYYYQAVWRRDIPVLHIASRDWTHRTGIQQGDAPVLLPVKIYTNLAEVELFIDGRSLGKKKAENYAVTFEVPFSSKEPFLFAQGEYQKKAFAAQDNSQGTWVQDGLRVLFTPIPARLDATNLKGLELAINVGSQCFFTSDESQTTAYLLEGNGQQENRENTFGIYVNGKLLEESISPCKESGYFNALRKKYYITNEQDHIDIRFHAISGTCFLNGIKLRNIY